MIASLPVRTSQAPASAAEAESTRLRLTFLSLLVVSLFVLLFARLWFLQVMAGERYAEAAEGNAVRTISLEAARGRLFDRDGELLVRNRYAQVVSIQPSEMGDQTEAVLADLADLLGLSVDEIKRRAGNSRVSPFRPKPIDFDVPDDIVFYIHENASTRYPGVYAERLPLREYPHGDLAAHLVGYTGQVSADELALPEFEDYDPGDPIGWAGVERTYESALRGVEGRRQVQVNARGDVLGDVQMVEPEPGSDLRLTIDLQAQELAEEALADGIGVARRQHDTDDGVGRGGTFAAPAGAVVVMDPRDGAIVAMASYPTYDPVRFVGGVGQDYWDYLGDPGNDFPLINRAVAASYPPGSVFKVVTAAAALEYGYMNSATQLPCPGTFEYNESVYANWTRRDSGPMDLATALEQSCDTVFYQLAQAMYEDETAVPEGEPFVERLSEEARGWGFGQRTEVDLPGERPGVVPGRVWRREFWQNARDQYCTQAQTYRSGTYERQLFDELCSPQGAAWRGGDAVNMSIGQGDVQTTPLQVANAFAAIANGGTLWSPHVGAEILHRDGTAEPVEPEPVGTLPITPENLAYIEAGLVRVTQPQGTAGSVFGDFPVQIAGKTGTAEIKPKQPFAWFVGYNTEPVEGQEYVIVAMVEEGGGGSQTAAPIVRRIFEGLFGLGGDAPITPGAVTD